MGLSTHRRPRFHLGLLIVAALCGAAVCDPATEKIERFEKWFSENGGTHGGFVLKPENTPNRSRGQWVVLATTDIHEDDVLFRVPLSSVM